MRIVGWLIGYFGWWIFGWFGCVSACMDGRWLHIRVDGRTYT